jgi:hypothetical protein
LPAPHTASHLPPVSAASSPVSSPFTPSSSTAHSSLRLASFVGPGGAPRRGVPHQTYGASSLSPELTRAIVAPPQLSVSRPARCHLPSVRTRGQDIVRWVRHRPRVIAENTFALVGRRGRHGSRAKSHARLRRRALARALEHGGHAPVGRSRRSWVKRTRLPTHCSARPGGPFSGTSWAARQEIGPGRVLGI